MASSIIAGGLDNFSRKLERLSHPEFLPLMEQWERIMVEDNRQGVMAGIQSNDRPMPAVTYRTGLVTPVKRQRGARFGTVAGSFAFGGSLTPAQYRRLTGPPLAPRELDSRVITNFVTRSEYANGIWYAEGGWADVTSAKGVHFLPFHFKGEGRLPQRDLRGVREAGRELARAALVVFVRGLFRG